MIEPIARIHVSPTQQRAAELFAFFADAIQFLGRTAWPVVDLIVRFWIAMPAIVSGLLMANDWNTALMLAILFHGWIQEPKLSSALLCNWRAALASCWD